MGLPELLDGVARKAMRVLNTAMDTQEMPPEEVPLLRARIRAAEAAATLKTRVDEAGFKAAQSNSLAGLLELVLQRKRELSGEGND